MENGKRFCLDAASLTMPACVPERLSRGLPIDAFDQIVGLPASLFLALSQILIFLFQICF
jgi:hypothetical protein